MKYFLAFITFLPTISINAQNDSACACCTNDHRQFDFWVGDWEVFLNDQLAGTNTIILMQDSCIIQENWTSVNGKFSGTSYNFYDAHNEQWHQTWVDNQGGNLQLSGYLENGSMVLRSSEVMNQKGVPIYHRITWTPNDDGSVRQHWESSPNSSDQWSSLFDGLYKRKEAGQD